MNNTDDLFKYDLKRVEKFNDTGFHVDCEADIFVDLDDEWHVSLIIKHLEHDLKHSRRCGFKHFTMQTEKKSLEKSHISRCRRKRFASS